MPAAVVAAALFIAGACTPDATLFDEGRRRPVARAGGASATSAEAPDDPAAPPMLSPVVATHHIDCVRVQLTATRPVDAVAIITIADAPLTHPLGNGATLFDAAFRVPGPADAPVTLVVEARDATGVVLRAEPIPFTVALPGGPLVITEVLANPRGAEGAQEFVELANVGDAPAETTGLLIEDAAGRDPLPSVTLPPGGRALIVGAAFAESGTLDVPPAPGTLVLRTAGRIGRDGLGQAGEVVRLIGPEGIRSSYGGWVDVRRPAWAGHSVHRRPEERACDHPTSWSQAPLPATPGW